MPMSHDTHYILQTDYVNTNLKALRLLNINSNQYGFLFITARYQEANGGKIEGWCEPMKFNNLYSKTGLKLSIGYELGMSESGVNAMYKTLIKKGLIEDAKTKFRVTPNYYVCNGELKQVQKPTQNTEETPVKQLKTPINKPTALKFSYEETEFFKDFTAFKEAALCCRNLPQNVDFKAYFNKLAKYYTTENKNAYTLETWREKVKTWLEQDRGKGNILRLDTEGVTDETLLLEIETFGKLVA